MLAAKCKSSGTGDILSFDEKKIQEKIDTIIHVHGVCLPKLNRALERADSLEKQFEELKGFVNQFLGELEWRLERNIGLPQMRSTSEEKK